MVDYWQGHCLRTPRSAFSALNARARTNVSLYLRQLLIVPSIWGTPERPAAGYRLRSRPAAGY